MIEIQNNYVIRDGKTIGLIDGDVCKLSEKIPPVVKGQIGKAAGKALAFELAELPQFSDENPKPTVDQPPVEERSEPAKRGDIPPPPPQHPAMGDKTPEYVAWAKQYLSEAEFQRRYGNRKLPASHAEFEHAASAPERRLSALEKNPTRI